MCFPRFAFSFSTPLTLLMLIVGTAEIYVSEYFNWKNCFSKESKYLSLARAHHSRSSFASILKSHWDFTISHYNLINPWNESYGGWWVWLMMFAASLETFFLLPLSGSVFSSSINFFLPRFGCLFFICLLSALTKVCLCRMSIVAKKEKNTEAATWYQRIIVTLSKHYWSCIKQYLLPSLDFKEFNEFNESSKDFKDDLRSA